MDQTLKENIVKVDDEETSDYEYSSESPVQASFEIKDHSVSEDSNDTILYENTSDDNDDVDDYDEDDNDDNHIDNETLKGKREEIKRELGVLRAEYELLSARLEQKSREYHETLELAIKKALE